MQRSSCDLWSLMFSSEGHLRIVTGLSEMCEENAECVVPSAVCSEGVCQCEPSFVPSADYSHCNGNRFVLPVDLPYAATELNLRTKVKLCVISG
jgi:hypothetical protein